MISFLFNLSKSIYVPLSFNKISPVTLTSGAVIFKTFKIAFPKVDLPDPDSPTIPIVSP